MINRLYFMNAKCTDSTGYCYNSKIGSYSSLLPNTSEVFKIMTNELKAELLEMRPSGNFEVVSFNRV